jgi:hypothetical protein
LGDVTELEASIAGIAMVVVDRTNAAIVCLFANRPGQMFKRTGRLAQPANTLSVSAHRPAGWEIPELHRRLITETGV